MNYQSQEEHDYYERAAEQAEAEYRQECAYQEYLDSLFTSGQKDLYALNRCIDMLNSKRFIESKMTEKDFLFLLKSEIEKPKTNYKIIDEMPF